MARETEVDVEWFGDRVVLEAMHKMSMNADRVGMMLHTAVVKSISKGQPVRRVGKRLVGLNPSQPGNPPHVLHGLLRGSIDYRKKVDKNRVELFIGANTKYARALEFGNPKSRLKPRPFLRPAISKNREKAIARLVKGVFPPSKRGRR